MPNKESATHGLSAKLRTLLNACRVVTTPQSLHIRVDDTMSLAHVENHAALAMSMIIPLSESALQPIDNWAVISDGDRTCRSIWTIFICCAQGIVTRRRCCAFRRLADGRAIFCSNKGESQICPGRLVGSWRSRYAKPGNCCERPDARCRRAQLAQPSLSGFFDQGRVLHQPNDRDSNNGWREWPRAGSGCHVFDLGDTPDSGYRTTYIPIGNGSAVRVKTAGSVIFVGLYFPATHLNAWTISNRPVNNEYDVIFAEPSF